MKIGLAFDLKDEMEALPGGLDDALEEYDCDETVDIIRNSLENAGHEVILLGGGPEFLEKITSVPVDFVFNIAEGRGVYRSREAQVPAVLEMLDIPYSGSDPQSLSICLDKLRTKQLVRAAGVDTPDWCSVTSPAELKACLESWHDYPAIVKPAFEGSSKGVRETSLVTDSNEAEKEIRQLLHRYSQPVMVESFIDGDEITVGLVGNGHPEVIGVMRVIPRRATERFVYSLEVKRDWQNLVDYECPARLPEAVTARLKTDSLTVFKTLDCRDFARVDFRVDRSGRPYFIEVNPLPGLGTYSDLVIMSQKVGLSHQALIQAVLASGLKRRSLAECGLL